MKKTIQSKFVTAVVAVAVVLSSFLCAANAQAATPAENQRTYAAKIAELYDLIRDARRDAGVPGVSFLPSASLQHIQPYSDMLAAGDLGLVRRELSGLKFPNTLVVGETLYAHWEQFLTPQFLMNVLMGSEGTRNSILRNANENVGVGWSRSPNGKFYVSIVFWGGAVPHGVQECSTGECVFAALGGETPTPTPSVTSLSSCLCKWWSPGVG